VLSKVRDLTALRSEKGGSFLIEVDGGVGPEHVEQCLAAGVDVFVAGTAYFSRDQDGRQAFAGSIEN